MDDGSNPYRNELAAAQARIATLEATIHADEGAGARWFRQLREQRASVAVVRSHFWGLGPDGLGVLVVATLLLATSALLGVLLGAMMPALFTVVVGGLFVVMMAFAMRNGRSTHFAREAVRLEEHLVDAKHAVALARHERQRLAVEMPRMDPERHVAERNEDERAQVDARVQR